MSRPMLLVFVFLILIITSQFEWRQQLVSDIDANPTESQKQPQISKSEESVKEKVIMAQERKIHSLNELVRTLTEQLQHCQSTNGTNNSTLSSLTENVIELERQQIMED